MQAMLLHSNLSMLRRRDEGGGCGAFGCFAFLLAVGAVIYFINKGRSDKSESLGASKRPMGSGSLQPHTFANPFPKCPNCAASSDKMKQQWDGLRKVTWTCGYCGNVQIQELKDEELPASARQRLGLEGGAPMVQGQQGYYPPQQGGMGGVGGLLTGMMLGSMLGGSNHDHRNDGDWGGGGDGGSSGGDWGDGGDSSSGGDWGDSGGGDSGGDSGGGDW